MNTNETATTTTELRHVDPHTLTIDTNIRTSNALPPADLIASIAAYGVLTPVRAVERDGILHVQDGQLRILAARETARETIPVYVVPDVDGDDKQQTAARIITQWNSNEQRAAMTARDKAEAVHQLSLAGVSATKIAKGTHQRKKDIDHTLAAAQSSTAMEALADNSLTIEQAATLAEYEDDSEAITMLMAGAERSAAEFERRAQHLRNTAADRAAIKATRTELETQGITTLNERPGWRAIDEGIYGLHQLVALDTGKRPDIDTVPTANRLAFVIAVDTTTWTDRDGNPVDDDRIDFDLLDEGIDPDTQAEDGWIDPRELIQHPSITTEILWYVHNLASVDNLATIDQYRASLPVNADRDTQVSAAQVAAAEAAAKEKQRLERRMVRELNKQAVAATEVRRAKLAQILARKTLPKGTATTVAAFIADTMVNHHDLFALNNSQGNAQELTTELLGKVRPLDALATAATAERIQIINLAIISGAHEAAMWKDAWRGMSMNPYSSRNSRTGWLRFLSETLGHDLADVEKVIVGDIKAEDINLD